MVPILPKPHKYTEQQGELILDYRCRITLDVSCEKELITAAKQLQKQIIDASGLELMIDRRSRDFHPGILLKIREDEKGDECWNRAEGYRLQIDRDMAVITGADINGLRNGVQTLRQVILQRGTVIPGMIIEDYPDLEVRGWFMDVTRGRVPKLSYLKEMADRCSMYKINQMQLYVEHTFLFDGFSEIWRDDTPLTSEDILELDDYCYERGIDLVPSIATFGHLYKVLRTRTFSGLSEIQEPEDYHFSFFDRMHHHTLNTTDENSMKLVYHMIDQYIGLFRSKLFNINADETFDLGKGRGKEMAEKIGVQNMYINWITELSAHIDELGKRPMIWGDIICSHPEIIKQLPKNIICMNWDYGLAPGDTNVRALWESGVHQYLCPGVQGWHQTNHLLDIAYANIRKMAEFAHKFDGEGLLTTDWGDYGHFQCPELALVGIIYGAALGWNCDMMSEADINRDISLLEYGDTSGALISILSVMSRQAVMHWGELVEFSETYRYQIAGKDMPAFWEGYRPRIESRLDHIDECDQIIKECCRQAGKLMPKLSQQKKDRLAPVFHMAEGQIIINRILKVLAEQFLDCRYEQPEQPDVLAEELETWYFEYRRQWHKISRESELYRIGEMIYWTADYLRKSLH